MRAVLRNELTLSLKQLGFFKEYSTKYHQIGRIRLPRSDIKLLSIMTELSRHLEHITISFATNAQGFFHLPTLQLDWERLQTLALSSKVLVSF